MGMTITREINVKNVKINDPFWTPKQTLMTDIVIPYQEKALNDEIPDVAKSHAIENFRIAAGLAEGEFAGKVFQDSDLAKWIEAVAYSLSRHPDPELEKRTDEIIHYIELAQQPDGYVNTFFILKEPEHRWQNLQECHELYCAGHMMEAAVAYYEATGKDTLLHVMERMADHIASRFGPDKELGIPGHQEIEIGLMRLYRVTGKETYRKLARFFIEQRGKDPLYFEKEREKRGWCHWGHMTDPIDQKYNQCHTTVYEQDEVVGHSVRANYMYTAMADLAASYKDEKLFQACKRLWNSMAQHKMYVTGGVGSTAPGEAYTVNYDLPNDTAYAETCASIAAVFFAKKMLLTEADGEYADLMERELYNGTISGIQLDGTRFFYVNPLEVNPGISGVVPIQWHVLSERRGWYTCACCPPNLVRLVESLGKYAWDESEDTIYSHLYLGQEATLTKADITVESHYPWEGNIRYTVHPKKEQFTLAIHIPGYVKEFTVKVNGTVLETATHLRKGYLYLDRNWKDGDTVEISFDIKVRRIYANSNVVRDVGCVALMRGPVVYCFEGVDNEKPLQTIRIPRQAKITSQMAEDGLLQGNVLLQVKAISYESPDKDVLYSEEPPVMTETIAKAVPYYVWGNRGANQMRVWMLESL